MSITSVAKLLRLPHEDRALLFEAATWLAMSRVAVAVLPFRHVGQLAARPTASTGATRISYA